MMMGTAMATVMVLVTATALAMCGDGKGIGYGDGYVNGNGNGEAIFVRSCRVGISDFIVCSCCVLHCCNTRLCGKVPKMPLLLTSSFA